MPPTQNNEMDILQAALIGLGHALGNIEKRISELRGRLAGKASSSGKPGAPAAQSGAKKRNMSPAARRRIALAQKKRWAAFNAAKTNKPAKPQSRQPKPPKRALSAEGRARIVAATKKRWAAFHKTQGAAKTPRKAARVASAPKKAPQAPPPAVAAVPAAE